MPSKIILLIGLQASTKSSAAREIQDNVPNSVILSRDTEKGTIDSLVPKAEQLIQEGKIIVLDNTNLTKRVRKLFIDLAKKHNVPIDGHYFKTSIEDCQIRHLRRMYEKFGEIYQTGTSTQHKKDPHCFGAVVLFKARNDLEEPTMDEGFSHLIMRDVPEITWPPAHKNKALFLDIDGTLRVTEHLENKYPVSPDEVQLIRPADEMRAKLESYRKKGYTLIGVSNQSGISKGILTDVKVDEIFDRTRSLLGYKEEEFPILYCPHRPAPITCFCRKPQSGMAMECIMNLKLNPTACLMVGDMKTDDQMAKRLKIPYMDVNEFCHHKMSRRNPSKMSYDHEINVQDYPFYRTIPIESISQAQLQILNRRKIVEYVKAPEQDYYEERAMPPPPEDTYCQACNSHEYYSEAPVERNDKSEATKLEERLNQLHRDIVDSATKLGEQEEEIKRNEYILDEQAKKIESQRGVIDHNITQINTTINTFSHNASAINYQHHQIHVNNSELSRQQYMDQTLKTQIAETQQQVDDAQAQLSSIQQELETCQQQLAYHHSMLGAFNTLIQNPQYFLQLMSAATNWTPPENPDGV